MDTGDRQKVANVGNQHRQLVCRNGLHELPDFFADRLLEIASSPQHYPDTDEEILKIIDMLSEYDTYAQTGYMGMGVSNVILESSLKQLETKRVTSGSSPKGEDVR